MADREIIDFIKAYQNLAPETGGLDPYEFKSKEQFLDTVKDYKPKKRKVTDKEAERYKFVLPEDFEYMPIEDRAKYKGYIGKGGGGREFPLEGISPFQTKDGKVASDIRISDYGNLKNKKALLEEKYSNRDKMSQGPRYKTLSEGKTPSYMLNPDGSRISNRELSNKFKEDSMFKNFPIRKPIIKKEKTKEAEKFVPKDTVLGRIFDDRIREGEEISNRDKAFALLRNIGDNLSERRLVGGKEGTDTFSRIFGKSGGLREGMDEIEALEDEVIAKEAASVDRALKLKKENASLYKTIADTAKIYHDINDQKFGDLEEEAIFAANTAMRAGDIDATGYDSFILEYMKNSKESRTGSTSALLNIYLDQLQRAAPEDQPDILRKIQMIEQDLGIYEEKDETESAEDIYKTE
tara:strand:+ start:234 stop:1457 length:1224 start_codon:yes stop_codon:yes gene_type:complete